LEEGVDVDSNLTSSLELLFHIIQYNLGVGSHRLNMFVFEWRTALLMLSLQIKIRFHRQFDTPGYT
jgi:hypothetical protein